MKRMVKTAFALIFALSLIPMVAQATYITVGFQRIEPGNSVDNPADQLGLTIWDAAQANTEYGLGLSGDEVLFTLTNAVGIPSSIREVYIDDGTAVNSLLDVYNSLGGSTNFYETPPDVNPSNLPGGNTLSPPFVATVALSVDSAAGGPDQGVNQAADILGISYDTDGGLAGVESAIADGSLRIGLHVQSIGRDGNSDGFVNTPPSPIPEPSTMLLLFTGLSGTVAYGWRRKRKS